MARDPARVCVFFSPSFKIFEITLQITFTEYMYIYKLYIYIYIHTETIFPKEKLQKTKRKEKCRYSRSLKNVIMQEGMDGTNETFSWEKEASSFYLQLPCGLFLTSYKNTILYS